MLVRQGELFYDPHTGLTYYTDLGLQAAAVAPPPHVTGVAGGLRTQYRADTVSPPARIAAVQQQPAIIPAAVPAQVQQPQIQPTTVLQPKTVKYYFPQMIANAPGQGLTYLPSPKPSVYERQQLTQVRHAYAAMNLETDSQSSDLGSSTTQRNPFESLNRDYLRELGPVLLHSSPPKRKTTTSKPTDTSPTPTIPTVPEENPAQPTRTQPQRKVSQGRSTNPKDEKEKEKRNPNFKRPVSNHQPLSAQPTNTEMETTASNTRTTAQPGQQEASKSSPQQKPASKPQSPANDPKAVKTKGHSEAPVATQQPWPLPALSTVTRSPNLRGRLEEMAVPALIVAPPGRRMLSLPAQPNPGQTLMAATSHPAEPLAEMMPFSAATLMRSSSHFPIIPP
uniref:Uncharacterized protein n=1 Tax=Chromera velia CCMP2878 TaxID=1169474 RepID=A0A0G4H4C1_9ALVE|eukprot:Cvel_24643.t1-p1 / transcript=Cvel_24643.t1 / gene=Cvel_24643 / organism=Chromera_velia_CCMP2878 / gene_product=hypothetical protein / transcript_product=hypothetical protein / location=Cvel_scaffold2692:3700-5104(+) / protein_length=392 / sequence_SO=supercontig / SO=protein_coding / is_pseudo=false